METRKLLSNSESRGQAWGPRILHLKIKKKVMMWKKTWAQAIILECTTKCITIYVIEH